MKTKHFLRSPSDNISFLIELPVSNCNTDTGRSVIEWTGEINKNLLTSVKRCLLFSRLRWLCQALKSMHEQKKHIALFNFSVQGPENVGSRKFHTTDD